MALATSTVVALAAAAAAAGMSAYNTNQTAKRQDSQAAEAIRGQSIKQRQADARVNEEVAKLQNSTSSDESAKRMADYSAMLRRNKAVQGGGLTTPNIGSATFRNDAAAANDDVQREGLETAGLMARMDAPGMQRQGEGFGFSQLATDLDVVKRESSGQAFIDDLRLRAIRRNPWIDLGAGMLSSYGSMGMSNMGGGAKPQVSQVSIPQVPRFPMNYGGS